MEDKKYIRAEIEIIAFEVKDIIITSDCLGFDPDELPLHPTNS